MKYYKLKHTDDIKDGFGGLASMWKIKILNKYRNDVGLLAHEKVHVRFWWYCLAATWLVGTGNAHLPHFHYGLSHIGDKLINIINTLLAG